MHLAWLCYSATYSDYGDEDGEESTPEIKFIEPEQWKYRRVVPIVWAPVTEFNHGT